LLMDEPLGALDKKLREQMQAEIRHIHRSVGTTVIYVTHDQSEALTMSDLVVVMHRARIAQIGTPRTLYESPASAFVADFLGDSNLIAATLLEAAGGRCAVKTSDGSVIQTRPPEFSAVPGQKVFVLVRPEDMTAQKASSSGAAQKLAGTVTEMSFHGDTFGLGVAVGRDTLKVKVPRAQGGDFAPGCAVVLSWATDAARLLPAEAEP